MRRCWRWAGRSSGTARFFGMPMARLDWFLRGTASALADLLDGTAGGGLDRLRARGVSPRDGEGGRRRHGSTWRRSKACGFRLMDALVTYFTHPHREPPTEVQGSGPGAPARSTATSTRCWRSPRRRMPAFAVGSIWIRTCRRSGPASSTWNGRVSAALAAWRIAWWWPTTATAAFTGGRAPGAWSRRRGVGGITLWAGSLGACRADKPGAYAGLIRSLAAANHAAGEVTETQTQNHNMRDGAGLRGRRRAIRARRLHLPRLAGRVTGPLLRAARQGRPSPRL